MTEQQELEAVLKHLKMTEKEFDFLCEAAYNKVIKKRVENDKRQQSL
tara:strand:+ start:824 stop:964 length:141 start_codon:yes stop_codon:yes gene_type:complete